MIAASQMWIFLWCSVTVNWLSLVCGCHVGLFVNRTTDSLLNTMMDNRWWLWKWSLLAAVNQFTVTVLAKFKVCNFHKSCYNHIEGLLKPSCELFRSSSNDFDLCQICISTLKWMIRLRVFPASQRRERGERCFTPLCLPRCSVFTSFKSGFSTAALSPSTSIWQD